MLWVALYYCYYAPVQTCKIKEALWNEGRRMPVSVCLFNSCGVPRPNSTTERLRSPKLPRWTIEAITGVTRTLRYLCSSSVVWATYLYVCKTHKLDLMYQIESLTLKRKKCKVNETQKVGAYISGVLSFTSLIVVSHVRQHSDHIDRTLRCRRTVLCLTDYSSTLLGLICPRRQAARARHQRHCTHGSTNDHPGDVQSENRLMTTASPARVYHRFGLDC